MSFLPTTYQVPESASPYMKFKDGVNKFRILSPAITGWEYWNKDNKPVRQEKPFDSIPNDIKLDDDGMPTAIKHFWAFVVYNYTDKMVQILEITQATIQRGLKIKIDNREGKATENDFIITRSGKGLLTEYDIDVAESSPVSPEIQKAYEAKNINLNALFAGADPFTAVEGKPASEGQIGSNKEVVADDIAEMASQMEKEGGITTVLNKLLDRSLLGGFFIVNNN